MPAARIATALIALGLGACTAASPGAGDVTTTPRPQESAAPVGHADFTDLQPCPRNRPVEVPPRSGCVSFVDGDLDGDGSADRLIVYARVTRRGRPLSWHLRADFASASSPVRRLEFPGLFSYPRAVGAIDADGDGRDEAFVKLSDTLHHPASRSPIVGIFKLEGGRLVRVGVAGRGPLEIDVGGTTRSGEGLDCRDADGDGRLDLILLRVRAADTERARWERRIYEWRGRTVALTEVRRGTIETRDDADPRVFRFYHLVCGSFDPPEPY